MLQRFNTNDHIHAVLLEDYQSDADLIEYYLKESFPNCTLNHVATKEEFIQTIETENPDVILSDFNLPNYSALEAYNAAKEKNAEVPFIIITGDISEEEAVNMIKKGIDDFLMKSSLTRIGIAVGQALQRRNSLSKLKDSGQILESNLEFINTILDHSGIAICEVEIPSPALLSQKLDFSNPNLDELFQVFKKFEIVRVNKRVIDLFEFKDFNHFEEDFTNIFDQESLPHVLKIILESQSKKIVKNKRVGLRSFKGHKKHINMNMVSRKVDGILSVIICFLDETMQKESELRTEKLLERMEKTIFERTKELRVVNQMLNEQAEETERINKVLEYNFNQTTDSIQAAKKIQRLMLPKISQIKANFSDAFVFYKAKDIVSGDFYWCQNNDDHVWIASADCTGHGVPGALMAMTGAHLLSEIVNTSSHSSPDEILRELDSHIIERLKQRDSGNVVSTGMDISLCKFHKDEMILEFSGALQDLFLKSDGAIQIFKGDRRGVGGTHEYKHKEFTNQFINLKKGDKLYLTSDGMPDQFGGENGKKLMKKRFIEILKNFEAGDMNKELLQIKRAYYEWKGQEEQIDDIIVMGLEI